MFRVMGGYGSGRSGKRPLAEQCLRVDIGWMLREGLAKDGALISGSLRWHRNTKPAGSISYVADLRFPERATLELRCTRGQGDAAERISQLIRLCHTRPHYGGRRWWMLCPYKGHHVLKLYLPPGADRFASRRAWRLAYRSQRLAPPERALDRMLSLRSRIAGQLSDAPDLPPRPKGMWARTYERLRKQYLALEAICDAYLDEYLTASLAGEAGQN